MLSVQCFSWKKVEKKAALMCKDIHPEKSSLLRVSWLDMRIFDIQKAVLLLKTFFFLRVVSVCMKALKRECLLFPGAAKNTWCLEIHFIFKLIRSRMPARLLIVYFSKIDNNNILTIFWFRERTNYIFCFRIIFWRYYKMLPMSPKLLMSSYKTTAS